MIERRDIERREIEPPAYERRVVSLSGDLRAELREAPDDRMARRIVGHAAVFDSWTTLHESPVFVWREVVRRGAFRSAIAERQDVRALWNHDANIVLGRTASGTLTLEEDAIGLLSSIDPPGTDYVRDVVLAPIARGDVDQMSFAFGVRRAGGEPLRSFEKDGTAIIDYGGERVTVRKEGGRTVEERELISLDLFDVSPVTNPAYQDTDVALRSLGERKEAEARGRVLAAERVRQAGRLRMAHARLRLVDARNRGGFPS